MDRDCKEYAHKNITASELIALGACELSMLIPLSNGNVSDLRIYDGRDNSAPLRMRLRNPADITRPYPFDPHIYLQHGLYVEFTDKLDGCFVQWRMRPATES